MGDALGSRVGVNLDLEESCLVSSLLAARALTSFAFDSAISTVRRLMVWVRAAMDSLSANVALARLEMASIVSCSLSALWCPLSALLP